MVRRWRDGSGGVDTAKQNDEEDEEKYTTRKQSKKKKHTEQAVSTKCNNKMWNKLIQQQQNECSCLAGIAPRAHARAHILNQQFVVHLWQCVCTNYFFVWWLSFFHCFVYLCSFWCETHKRFVNNNNLHMRSLASEMTKVLCFHQQTHFCV